MDLEYRPEPAEQYTRRKSYHDSDGNFLTIFDSEDEPLPPNGFEVEDFLASQGYDGPGDWHEG